MEKPNVSLRDHSYAQCVKKLCADMKQNKTNNNVCDVRIVQRLHVRLCWLRCKDDGGDSDAITSTSERMRISCEFVRKRSYLSLIMRLLDYFTQYFFIICTEIFVVFYFFAPLCAKVL